MIWYLSEIQLLRQIQNYSAGVLPRSIGVIQRVSSAKPCFEIIKEDLFIITELNYMFGISITYLSFPLRRNGVEELHIGSIITDSVISGHTNKNWH